MWVCVCVRVIEKVVCERDVVRKNPLPVRTIVCNKSIYYVGVRVRVRVHVGVRVRVRCACAVCVCGVRVRCACVMCHVRVRVRVHVRVTRAPAWECMRARVGVRGRAWARLGVRA